MLGAVRSRLRALADPERAAVLRRFFKTGPGEYGEGDRFLGIPVPALRHVAQEFRGLPFAQVKALLRSPLHEERLLALLILVDAFARGDARRQARIYRFYRAHTRHINNWDLVDLSAHPIVGAYLAERDRAPLDRLARSPSLWERRIAILATYHGIRRHRFGSTLRIARRLLRDEEDLIHKAVGWMLREVGKRDRPTLERFLQEHGRTMPRTMLRYAIERLPAPRRRQYLKRYVSAPSAKSEKAGRRRRALRPRTK